MKLIQQFFRQQPDPRIAQVLTALATLEKLVSALDDKITQLQNDVAAEKVAEQAAVTLIGGIAQQIKDAVAAALAAGATPQQLQSLTDLSTAIEGQTSELSAAVAANTPAAAA